MSDRTSMDDLRDTLALILAEAHSQEAQMGKNPNVMFWESAVDAYNMVAGNAPCVIGVWGTPNVGKSTLLNSIVGESILPTGPTPVTGCVVDLKIRPKATVYHVNKTDGKQILDSHDYSRVEDVRRYLKEHGGQDQSDKSEHIRIEVEGPFPRALPIMGEKGYLLRDTPGAESGEAMLVALTRDTKRTLAAMEEVSIPLFCVRGDSMGQNEDVEFYEKFFRHRLCLHIITHCDDPSENEETIDDFRENFKVSSDDHHPSLITCVGVDANQIRVQDKLITIGLDDLVANVEKYLTRDFLGDTLRSIAQLLVQSSQDENGRWDLDRFRFHIPGIHLRTLKLLLEAN